MSNREDINLLEARIEALEEVVDFLTQDLEEVLDEDFLSHDEELPDELISESELVHQAYASHAAHSSVGDRQAFISGYLARAREEYGVYAA